MKFIDPAAFARLSHLHMRVGCVVEGLLSGLHQSPRHGHSLEFSQHREYSHGDELRRIDWKVFARSDRFFVKQFQDETNLRAWLLLDASASMKFAGAGRPDKLTYASWLTASLAYLLLRQEDAVSLGIFDSSLRFFLPPRHQLSHLSLIFKQLENITPGGETEISSVLSSMGKHMRRRGLLVLVSDLMSDPVEVIKALKYFRYRHHEVMVFHVMDDSERFFQFSGEKTFVDLENGRQVYGDADALRAAYRRIVEQFIETYKTGFRQAGIHYHLVSTGTPLEKTLAQCLTR